MAKRPMPTPEDLRALLQYDEETGKLFWKRRSPELFADTGHGREANCAVWNARFAGRPAFSAKASSGYLTGAVFAHSLKAHRVAWAIFYGAWPDGEIDHINHVRDDNRIVNLRAVDRRQNAQNTSLQRNNSSGVTGVSRIKGRWRATIYHNGKRHDLGRYDTRSEAIAKRKAAERAAGFHENHGKRIGN